MFHQRLDIIGILDEWEGTDFQGSQWNFSFGWRIALAQPPCRSTTPKILILIMILTLTDSDSSKWILLESALTGARPEFWPDSDDDDDNKYVMKTVLNHQ